MPNAEPEVEGASIVALGSFNPAIFHPIWFTENNLMRKEEASGAKIEIIHPEATVFKTEWFSLQVTRGSFMVESLDPTKWHPLRDLARGTFKILEHSPITAFGFNKLEHFRMQSVEAWHAFGHFFAPKASWVGILNDPGMGGLMIQGTRENCDAIHIQVRIAPSPKVHPGVFIHVNQEYNVGAKDERPSSRILSFLRKLDDAWEDFLVYCKKVSAHLFASAQKG